MVWIIIAVAVIACITGTLVFLPALLRTRINRKLGSLETVTGSVAQVRVDLAGSKLRLDGFRLDRRDALPEQPSIVYIPHMHVSFQWKTLLRKTFDLTIRIEEPCIQLTAQEADAITDAPASGPANLKDIIAPLAPFHIDLEVIDGVFRYINASADPAVDVTISALHLRMRDFTNRADATHISSIHAGGVLYNGKLALQADLHPLADTLTFHLTAAIRGADLCQLNEYLRRYARVDVSAGTMDLYAELFVANNMLDGELTPTLQDLIFRDATDARDGFFKKLWERTVATGIRLLTRRGEITTRIPIRGTLDNPNINAAAAMVGIFKNAFARSIRPSLTNVLSLDTLRETARATARRRVQKSQV